MISYSQGKQYTTTEGGTKMKKYQVSFYDFSNGATSEIDTIEAPDGYTAEQYVADCRKNADDEWVKMLENGDVTLYELEG